MKKTVRFIFAFFASCLTLWLSGCAYNSNYSKSPIINEPVFEPLNNGGYASRNISDNWFDKVVISGNVDANIELQQPEDQLRIMGSPNMRRSFANYIRHHTLYLVYGNYPSNVSARVPLRVDLKLSTPLNQIMIKGDGKTHLSGDLILTQLAVGNNALLYAYWIDSTNIHIFAGDNAKVFLGGVATNVDIIARNRANIDARFLRADNAFVRTQDGANVAVKVKNSLSTLSTGASTVYYYGDSNLNIHYLGNHGSALRMTGIAK
jgi:hypothetical protein